MVRTIISLPESDKRWLDQYGSLHGQSMAEVIREAVKTFQRNVSRHVARETLKKTAGILKSGPDGLKTVRQLRSEWE